MMFDHARPESAAVPPPGFERTAGLHLRVREAVERALRTQEGVHAIRESAAQTRAEARLLRAELATRRARVREQLSLLGVVARSDRPAATERSSAQKSPEA